MIKFVLFCVCVCVNCAFIMQTEWTLLFIKWPEMQRLLSCKATQTYCPYSNALACISPTPPLHRSESTKPLQTAVTIPSEFLLSDLQSKHNKTFLKSLLFLKKCIDLVEQIPQQQYGLGEKAPPCSAVPCRWEFHFKSPSYAP